MTHSDTAKVAQSVFLHAGEHRHMRKKQLLTYIVENTKHGEVLSVDRIVGLFGWEWGIGTRTIRDYFSELQAIGAISTNNEKVTATDFGKKLVEEHT